MYVCCCCMVAQGINFLFPVQTSTYDHISEGHDVIVQASKRDSYIKLLVGARFCCCCCLYFYRWEMLMLVAVFVHFTSCWELIAFYLCNFCNSFYCCCHNCFTVMLIHVINVLFSHSLAHCMILLIMFLCVYILICRNWLWQNSKFFVSSLTSYFIRWSVAKALNIKWHYTVMW